VLPQAARVIIPPLGNEFNNMLKTTSLLFVLGVIETYNHYNIAQGLNYQPFEEFLGCALWYLLMTTIWGVVQSRIELRFARGTTVTTQQVRVADALLRFRAGIGDAGALGGH